MIAQTCTRGRRVTSAGILLELGLGSFFDGIVLHQMLQWHHMVSNVAEYPVTTISGPEANTLAGVDDVPSSRPAPMPPKARP